MGVFIYKTKGTFPNNFIMEGVDILLMAKGSSAEVGYVTNGDLIGDLCDLELEEYSRAMIHSHHSMSVSPSTTDINELKSAASTGPYYLSVIVNNKLDIKALVGIKKTYKGKVKSSYKNLWNKLVSETAQEIEYEDYEIIECEVEKQIPQYMLDINTRISEKLQDYNTSPHSKRAGYTKSKQDMVRFSPRETVGKQQSLFREDEVIMGKISESNDVYESFIPSMLEAYCWYANGTLKSAYNAAISIENDSMGFGIPFSAIISYLLHNEVGNKLFTDNLIKELQNPQVWV